MLALPESAIEGMTYLPDARMLLVSAAQATRVMTWAIPFDPANLAAGQPRAVFDGVVSSVPSLDGSVTVAAGVGPRVQELRWFAEDGREIATVPQGKVDLREISLAPDGNQLSVRALSKLGGQAELWVYDYGARLGDASDTPFLFGAILLVTRQPNAGVHGFTSGNVTCVSPWTRSATTACRQGRERRADLDAGR